MSNSPDTSTLDPDQMQREIDRVKSDLFMTPYAAFYGALLCSLEFRWDKSVPTAATDGLRIYWNPDFFFSLPRAARKTVLRHEIDHCARLHFDRMGSRNPKLWNIATDYRINNSLDEEKDRRGNKIYSFEGLEGCVLDQNFCPSDMPEEDIYDLIVKNAIKIPESQLLSGDLIEDKSLTKEERAKAVSNVVRARQQAKLAGAGNMPGDIDTLLDKFLAPVVPWEGLLYRWFTDLVSELTTWSLPNRRYHHSGLYLPSRYMEEGLLAHLMYFEDVSGSTSDENMIRFNSEIKYIKEAFSPEKMTLVQFDTKICYTQDYAREDPFDHVVRKGNGGTSWSCVREHIIEKQPTAVIVFTDMGFWDPITPLPFDIPIIWVCVGNSSATAPFGHIVHINE